MVTTKFQTHRTLSAICEAGSLPDTKLVFNIVKKKGLGLGFKGLGFWVRVLLLNPRHLFLNPKRWVLNPRNRVSNPAILVLNSKQ